MSLLRRKRRQNRLNSALSPATRETRFSLEPVSTVRGLRFVRLAPPGLRRLLLRKTKSPGVVIGNAPNITDYEIKRFERNVLFDQYRRRYQEVMSKRAQPRVIRKPLNQISLRDYVNKTVTVDLPPEHPICVQREERRMVMFATGKAGQGGQRPRNDNNQIKLRCK